MYLSYSGYKKLVSCAFAYWNEYIGKTKKGAVDDRLGSVYGTVVGRLFEDFYKLKAWKQEYPIQFIMDRVVPTIADVIKKETSPWKDKPAGVLLWKGEGPGQNPRGMYENRGQLEADVRDAVSRGFKIIKHHRLLGPRTDAEFKLDFVTTDGHILAGRADFIIHRISPQDDEVIVDGKGSQHRDKYVDPQQLQWYAMLYWLNSAKAGDPKVPDKLAFLFWRSNPEESMDWIDTSEEEAKQLYEEAVDKIRWVEESQKKVPSGSTPEGARGVFKPKATEQNCRFCPYASVCPPGAKVQEKIRERQERKR